MIIKKLFFPIFLFVFLFQSCKKDFEIDKESSRANNTVHLIAIAKDLGLV